MEAPKEFFTLQSMGTLVGASGVTYIVSSGIQRAFGCNPKWLALLVAEIVCIGYVVSIGNATYSEYFVAIINGFLVFSTAVGANAIGGAGSTPSRGPDFSPRSLDSAPKQIEERGWLSSWF